MPEEVQRHEFPSSVKKTVYASGRRQREYANGDSLAQDEAGGVYAATGRAKYLHHSEGKPVKRGGGANDARGGGERQRQESVRAGFERRRRRRRGC